MDVQDLCLKITGIVSDDMIVELSDRRLVVNFLINNFNRGDKLMKNFQ